MASITVSASLQKACTSHHHVTKKQQHQNVTRSARSLGSKVMTNVVSLNVESQKEIVPGEQQGKTSFNTDRSSDADHNLNHLEAEYSAPRFMDERWKKGTWDLNMFVVDGKMDWDSLIVAEAKRRNFLELYPEATTNEEPVLFRSSIIPWWAWLKRSYLPEAELLNGRAAMIGFFASYVVDALTGLDMVGQTGSLVCKAGLLLTVIGVIVLRRSGDIKNLKKLADEATFYDKQWQASWQDQSVTKSGSSRKTGNLN